jgi:uncharacterized protein (DUF1697 family)
MKYAAFLRGVTPVNVTMGGLKRAFEAAGFKNVKTILASGNVVFDAPKSEVASLEEKAEAAMQKTLKKTFLTIVRPVDELQKLLKSDPYLGHQVDSEAKRVVTFLRNPPASLELPIEEEGARVLKLQGNNLFTAYVSGPATPVFMKLIAKAAGKEQTTRTWQTLEKVVGSAQA